jgi:ATP-dependent Lon protease
VLAAYRSGLREVIMPKANEKDLRDIPDEVKSHMTFRFVERMDDVLRIALLPAVPDELVDTVQPEPSPGLAGLADASVREEREEEPASSRFGA